MISYFNIIIDINIITNPSFSVLKILIVILSYHRFIAKVLFLHTIELFTFFDHINNKNASLPIYVLKDLLNLSSTHTSL